MPPKLKVLTTGVALELLIHQIVSATSDSWVFGAWAWRLAVALVQAAPQRGQLRGLVRERPSLA
ncbi:hypothetical protein D2E76_15895 [Mycobacteroides abscessus]|uniref:Uncharacterized protein n=1 Tax=Mycobacteroides abscessus TaxID=36809 RepID=A0ABD7HMK1_9MYCO|nr:hypothetical protein D2E76_15895 [Mycobacteroides abscessus]